MLHHLDLNVSDLARSNAFYGAILGRLGYVAGEAGDGWTTWRGGGFYITLVQTTAPHAAAGSTGSASE